MVENWSNWMRLGKPGGTDQFVSLAVGQNQDGRLEIFAGGPDGLWHIWQTVPNGDWSDWSRLGNPSVGAPYHSLAVGQNHDGRLEVFTLSSKSGSGDTNLLNIWQTAPNGGWSDWNNLGRPDEPGGFFDHRNTRRRLAVGQNQDGRLEVFTVHWGDINKNPAVANFWHIWQTAPNNGWSGWDNLGHHPESTSAGGGGGPFHHAVGKNHDGRLELFVTGSTDGLFHIWQTAPNNGWSKWRNAGETTWDTVAIAQNQDGRLEVFIVASMLMHSWQTAPNNGWSDWKSLNSPPDEINTIIANIAVGQNQDGRLELFAVVNETQLQGGNFWHIWQTAPNNDWSDWHSLGRPSKAADFPTHPGLSDFTVGRNQDGRLEVFASDREGEIWHIWQRAVRCFR